jgi:glycosyltransferase involved in cell wall biosynthesis
MRLRASAGSTFQRLERPGTSHSPVTSVKAGRQHSARRRITAGYVHPVLFSVIVPAHNEERLLPRGLAAIELARERIDGGVEVIVVANRCTDATVTIATDAGAIVVENDARNISAVRNAGAAVATGDAIVTVDADCVMSPSSLSEIERMLATGRYVGGGTKVRPERTSAGIRATLAVMELATFVARVSGAMFWCCRSDFEAIGGFDERRSVAEDVDFARRLRARGRRTGRKFAKLRSAPLTVSTRKFDRYGDWHMFAMAFQLRAIRAAFDGSDTSWADEYFFDFNDQP